MFKSFVLMNDSMIVIDANKKVAGRLASVVAKLLLKGENVVVVNAEKAVVSGRPETIIKRFKELRSKGDPYKGPFYPKRPDRIFRRMVRGMLPYKKKKGKDALRRLKVYIGVPEEFSNVDFANVDVKTADDLITHYLTLEEISLQIGARKTW